jgi:hypothetical protein
MDVDDVFTEFDELFYDLFVCHAPDRKLYFQKETPGKTISRNRWGYSSGRIRL